MLHVIHCIQSGCFGPCCIKSTAFNHAARNPLHSIGMHFTRLPGIHAFITLHGLHCIQSGSIAPQCMESSHSLTLHVIHCIQSGCFGPCCIKSTAFNRVPTLHAAWNPLHSIRMLWAMLNKFHCIQRRCMESTEFNWDTLY